MRHAIAIGIVLVAGCATAPPPIVSAGRIPVVHQITLPTSNIFLIRSAQPILIDAGSPGDLPALERALGALGLALSDVKLAILTHGHGDHAGLGADLRRAGVVVAAGAGDVALTEAGRNDELRPRNLTARLIRPFIDFAYEPFTPDIAIDARGLDLRPYGVKGRAFQLPGHTAGSVVVALADGSAFVGDVMLGGIFGGAFFAEDAGEHYYHADPDQNRANTRALLRRGVEVFYLGHGGPVTRASVIEGFDLGPGAHAPAAWAN